MSEDGRSKPTAREGVHACSPVRSQDNAAIANRLSPRLHCTVVEKTMRQCHRGPMSLQTMQAARSRQGRTGQSQGKLRGDLRGAVRSADAPVAAAASASGGHVALRVRPSGSTPGRRRAYLAGCATLGAPGAPTYARHRRHRHTHTHTFMCFLKICLCCFCL